VNTILNEILRTGMVNSVNGQFKKVHSNISPQQGEFLQQIILDLKPKITLEIGLAYGISALFICDKIQNIPDSYHIIIDPHQLTGWEGIGINNLKKAGYEGIIKFYNQISALALPHIIEEGIKIDFAFIDGMHTFDHTLVDFLYIDQLLNVGGIVVLDDTNLPSIRKVCRFIVKNRRYSVYRCLENVDSQLSLEQQLLRIQAYTCEIDMEILKSEIVQPDFELGLFPSTRCIAFKKEAEDTREWNFHQEF